MRTRRFICATAAAIIAGWLIRSALPTHTPPPAPTLCLVSIEEAGMIDKSGTELSTVIFAINNTNGLQHSDDQNNIIYVKDVGRLTEVKVGDHWSTAPAASATSALVCLYPGHQDEQVLLAPIGTTSCRVWLKYTGSDSSYPHSLRGVAASIAWRLPLSVRSRISYRFWRWVGFPGPRPDTHWRDVCMELPLSLPDSNASLNETQ